MAIQIHCCYVTFFYPDTWFFVANIGVVSYWRGMWGFWDDYFLPEKSYPWPILSNLFSALIGEEIVKGFMNMSNFSSISYHFFLNVQKSNQLMNLKVLNKEPMRLHIHVIH